MSFTSKALQSVLASGINQTQGKAVGQSSGEAYKPAQEEEGMITFVSYIETGKENGDYKGTPKVYDKAFFVFELSGDTWVPNKTGQNGEKIPYRITIEENISQYETSGYFKLVKILMKANPSAVHVAQLLGECYIGDVKHSKWILPNGKEAVNPVLKTKEGHMIKPAVMRHPITKEMIVLEKPKRLSKLALFLWNHPDQESWDNIYIPGDYNGKSANKFQDKCRAAINFNGSALQRLLGGTTEEVDEEIFGVEEEVLDDAEMEERQRAADKKSFQPARAVVLEESPEWENPFGE